MKLSDELQELYKEYSQHQSKELEDWWEEEDYWDGIFASKKQISDGYFDDFILWLRDVKKK